MAMLLISLGLSLLAVTRITRLMVEDRLTLKYRTWVIKKWGEASLAGYFVYCPWCTSIWVALLVMPGAVLFPNKWVIAALAVPAASMVAGLFLDRE
jgi:hypothetical protein